MVSLSPVNSTSTRTPRRPKRKSLRRLKEEPLAGGAKVQLSGMPYREFYAASKTLRLCHLIPSASSTFHSVGRLHLHRWF